MTIEITFHNWLFECDPDRTRRAYSQVPQGDAKTCGCNTCRNYLAQKKPIFPSEIMQLFNQTGIDPLKDAEIYHMGKDRQGHYYGGWFHFIGRMKKENNPIQIIPDFLIDFRKKDDLAHETLVGEPLIQADFYTHLSWVLDEEEPK